MKKLVVSLNFSQRSLTKTKYLSKCLKHTLKSISPITKSKSIVDVLNSQLPNTCTNIVLSIKLLTSTVDMEPFNELKKRQYYLSNCARKLIIKALSSAKNIEAKKKAKMDTTVNIAKHKESYKDLYKHSRNNDQFL